MAKILLVEQASNARKSKNHWDFEPVALRRLNVLLTQQGNAVEMVRLSGTELFAPTDFCPDEIWLSLTFTYRLYEMIQSLAKCRVWYPSAFIKIGGPAVTILETQQPGLIEREVKAAGIDNTIQLWKGLYPGAEDVIVLWDELELDYAVITGSRGCPRTCRHCGAHIIEDKLTFKPIEQILKECRANKAVFTDNSVLARTDIHEFLKALAGHRWNGKVIYYEFQSGLDYRLMTAEIAKLLFQARVKIPRLAWDLSLSEMPRVRNAFDMLINAGYRAKDMFCFVLYNGDMTYEQIEEKRRILLSWGVRISDCRLRPLTQLHDWYNPREKQSSRDYYIGEESGWTDSLIKQFRKNCRSMNLLLSRNLKKDAPLEVVLYYQKQYNVPDQIMREFGFLEYMKAVQGAA